MPFPLAPHDLLPSLSLVLAALAIGLGLGTPAAQAQTSPAPNPALGSAFDQGKALGQGANAGAAAGVRGGQPATLVPGFGGATPPEGALFGAGGGAPALGPAATLRAQACRSANGAPLGTSPDPACAAIDFTQSNPAQRPSFTIAPNDPLRNQGRVIANDPQAIAGNLAGHYTDCQVQSVTTPDRFETALCHSTRTLETLSCEPVLTVTPVQTPGCVDGQFLTRVNADPCPACTDALVFDFTCGVGSYHLHAYTVDKASGALFTDLGSLDIPASLNAPIATTPGPSQVDASFCYQTTVSQTCAGLDCTIVATFTNPCQGTQFSGSSTFAMPTQLSFVDSWDSSSCAALEARLP